MSLDSDFLRSDLSSSLPNDELAELADEMRLIWRTLSRGTHLSGSSDQTQRQQFWVLKVLSNGPKRMSDLATYACTSQASITGIIDRLETLGFVERIRPTQDRRVVEVALTEAGRAEKQHAQEHMAHRLAALLEPLDSDETKELLRLFRKMSGNQDKTFTESV